MILASDEYLTDSTDYIQSLMSELDGSNCDYALLQVWDIVPKPGRDIAAASEWVDTSDWIQEGGHCRIFSSGKGFRFKGLIHEEPSHPDGRHFSAEPGYHKSLRINHLALQRVDSKNVAEEKANLYGILTLRGYEHPELRLGTNDWWFSHWAKDNLEAIKLRREKYLKQHGYDPL
jgi:hypothetical protein